MQSISELSADYLIQALGTLVEQVRAEPVGRGFMADVYRVHLDSASAPPSVILKLPAEDGNRRSEADTFNSYGKESFFYRELASATAIRTPHCFYNPADRFCLLLEDAGSGYDPIPPGIAMHTLAQLHQTPYDQLELPVIENAMLAAEGMLRERGETFFTSDCFIQHEASTARKILSRYCEDSLALLPHLVELPQVLSHMDFRPDNLALVEAQLMVFDWGEFCLAPRGLDIATALITCCESEVRQRQESSLLHEYTETAGINFEEAYTGYRIALLPLVYLPMLMQIRGAHAAAATLSERLVSAVEDHADFLSGLFG